MCLTRLWISLIRISGYNRELKAYVVMDKKIFIYWSLLAKVILSQLKEKYCFPKAGEEWAFASHWMDFYISTFTGKRHLSQLTGLRMKYYFASSQDEIPSVCEKVLNIAQWREKEFDVSDVFLVWKTRIYDLQALTTLV